MKKWNLMLIFILLAGGGFVFSQSITVIQPNGGEELAIGSSYEIKWNAVGNTNPFLISLWKDVIRVSTIKSTTLCAGIGIKTFNWTVGNLEGGGKASAGPGYKVKVKERDVAVSDKSNGEFKIMLTSAPTADLIFTKLSVSPKSPTVLDTITLYFVIQNTGTERMEATQAKVEIKRNNGIKIREKIVNIFALDPNKTFSARLVIKKIIKPANYSFEVRANIGNIPGESNYDNNLIGAPVTVHGIPDLIVCGCNYVMQVRRKTNLRAMVKNIGSGRSGPTTLYFGLTGRGSTTFKIPALNPGMAYHVKRRNSWRTKGTRRMVLKVDPGNKVFELKENNNRAENSVVVDILVPNFYSSRYICSDGSEIRK